jgi:hypothetical protein
VISNIICSPAVITDPAPFTATELPVNAMLVGDNVLAGSTERLAMGEDDPEKSCTTPLKLPLVALPLDVYDWIIWSADTVIPNWENLEGCCREEAPHREADGHGSGAHIAEEVRRSGRGAAIGANRYLCSNKIGLGIRRPKKLRGGERDKRHFVELV